MYPLPVTVAGCGEQVLPALRRDLLNYGIKVDALLPSMASAVLRRNDIGKGQRLFIVQLDGPQDHQELRRLTRTYPGKPVLALMPGNSAVLDVVDAQRAGASQVVLTPVDAQDFQSALNGIAMHHGPGLAGGQVLAVSGVTGGCGATTLATNLAYEFAETHDRKVVLAELTLQMGMLVTCLDIKPTYNLEDLLAYAEELDVHLVEQSLTRCNSNLLVLAGPDRPIAPSAEVAAKLATIVDYLRYLGDIVILDLPCTFDDAYFDTLGTADRVILVGEQRIPSVRNVQLVLNTLGAECQSKVRLAVNRYDPRFDGFTASELQKLLELPAIDAISNDPVNVPFAMNRAAPLRQVAPDSPVLDELAALARKVLMLPDAGEASAESPAPTVFGRFCHALGLA